MESVYLIGCVGFRLIEINVLESVLGNRDFLIFLGGFRLRRYI